jgi:hypothetical protein
MGKLKELLLGTREQQIDREQMLEMQYNAHYDECANYVQEWKQGTRSPLNATISEFNYLNKPTNGSK